MYGSETRMLFVSYWSLRHWAAKLAAPAAAEGQRLVELERVGGREPGAGIQLVGERYLLRLWPQVRAAQLREVLAALEGGQIVVSHLTAWLPRGCWRRVWLNCEHREHPILSLATAAFFFPFDLRMSARASGRRPRL